MIILSLALIGCANAIEETYDINVVDTNAIVTHTILINDEIINQTFDFNIPKGSKGVSFNVDGSYLEPTGESYDLKNVKKSITLEYVTDLLVSNDEIIFNFQTIESDLLTVTVVLDEDSSLKYAIGKGEITTSIYPSEYTLSSNGRNLIISWKRDDFKAKEFSGLILLEKKSFNYAFLTYILLILIIILFGYSTWTRLNKNKINKSNQSNLGELKTLRTKKVLRKNIVPISKPNDSNSTSILEHLKEDEAQVVRILKNKDGSAEQGTIRVIGNFSKATLSRLLSELEQRNIIYKEKKGKKNLVHLKKD